MPDAPAMIRSAVATLDDSSYEYEQALTRLVDEASSSDPTFGSEVRKALDDEQANSDAAYALFYALNIYYRRRKEYSSLAELLQTAGDRFRDRLTYPHLRALYCAGTRQDEEAFRCASAARDKAPQHPGILNHYAELILDREEGQDTPDPEMLNKAEEALDSALSLTRGTYGRHYGTKARLHILRGEYQAADEAADRAIDLENRAAADYPIRIGEYAAIKLRSRLARSSRRILVQQQETLEHLEGVRRSVDEARSDALQLLGLLAAVIAFVVGTTSIAAQLRDFKTSGRLLVLFTGSILIVYAGFGAVYGKASWKHPVVLALGLAVGAFSLFWWRVS